MKVKNWGLGRVMLHICWETLSRGIFTVLLLTSQRAAPEGPLCNAGGAEGQTVNAGQG